MFLFKRRKDISQEQTALEKTESTIKLAKEKSNSKSQLKAEADTDKKKSKQKEVKSDKTENAEQSLDTDIPMKVVIPASSLLEDQELSSVKVPETNKSAIAEEDLDKLLVKVNQGEPVVEIPDISLDILAPPTDEHEKTLQSANKPEVKFDSKPEVKNESNTENKSESKPETKDEVKPAESAPDKATKAEGDGKENLFSNLFGKVEVEEDNPTQRLIHSLPDISIEEVLNEAEEVKGLMHEWYVNQGKHVIK
jgi:hypothetical protein